MTDKIIWDKFWIGPNYWPAHAGIHMWSDWRPELVSNDLQRMVELGFTVNRSFIFMPDFIPTDEQVEPVMLQRFLEFLALCQKVDIQTIPTFFVGHMSGEDWDVDWRKGRNFYTDPDLLAVQKMYIQTVMEAAKGNKAIAGWLATNEIFNYAPDGTGDEIAEWGWQIVHFIKQFDDIHPVSLGEGARGPETNRRLKNFETRKYIDFIDFIGLHFYPRSANPWHQAFTPAFRVNIAQFWQLPVIVEEFGHSTAMGSEKNQADYYRTVLYSALINGAAGTLNWCYTDFDLINTRPYSHHPFEMRFGLVKTDGILRPCGEVMAEFAPLAKELYNTHWTKVNAPEVAVLIPSNYYYRYPHDYDTAFEDWYPLYLDVFAQLKRGGINPRLILEPAIELEKDGEWSHPLEINPEEFPVLIIPRLKRMSAQYWKNIQGYVEKGGTLYASFAQDHWLTDWEEFFGITSDLKFGLPCVLPENTLEITAQKEWGSFKSGPKYSLNYSGDPFDIAVCPVSGQHSEIILQDAANRPVLVHHQLGQGHVYYALFPLEMIGLKQQYDQSDELLQCIYRSLWEIHGKTDEIRIEGKDLEWGIWKNNSTDTIKIVIMNHASEERRGRIHTPRKIEVDELPEHIKTNNNALNFFLSGKDSLDLELRLRVV